jgi:hypothetical protein
LRELRRDELLAFFVREHGEGHLWGVWVFGFPSLARSAADRREAAVLSWLVAEALPSDAPGLVKRCVLDAEQWMWVRLCEPDPDPANWL